MKKLKLGRFRSVLNLAFRIFGHRSIDVKVSMDWQESPWSLLTDCPTVGRRKAPHGTGRRVKPLSSQ
jgi:hypothetical protein